MPPLRKEPKETVVYPASKRKVPPFKPLRPSKAPRLDDSQDANTQTVPSATASRSTNISTMRNGDSGRDQIRRKSVDIDSLSSESEEELAANPLAAKSQPTKKSSKAAPTRREPVRQASPVSVSSSDEGKAAAAAASPDADNDDALSTQSNSPTIPQPLLVRLLHEHFVDKATKIDKHAIQVLQRYLEVFVKETIARAQLLKEQDAERDGKIDEVDVRWLELEDLEKVAAGMLLDF